MKGKDKYISESGLNDILNYIDEIDEYCIAAKEYRWNRELNFAIIITTFFCCLFLIIYKVFSSNLLIAIGAVFLICLWVIGFVIYVKRIIKRYNAQKLPIDKIREILEKRI